MHNLNVKLSTWGHISNDHFQCHCSFYCPMSPHTMGDQAYILSFTISYSFLIYQHEHHSSWEKSWCASAHTPPTCTHNTHTTNMHTQYTHHQHAHTHKPDLVLCAPIAAGSPSSKHLLHLFQFYFCSSYLLDFKRHGQITMSTWFFIYFYF